MVTAAERRPRPASSTARAPVFAGPITDRDGKERAPAGSALDDAALLKMDWYVEGVQG